MISNATIGIMQQQQQQQQQHHQKQQGSFTQLSQEKINIIYRYLTFKIIIIQTKTDMKSYRTKNIRK
jgi:hypothetical protein